MDFDLTQVEQTSDTLAQDILNTDDPKKVKDLTALFNMNQSKKNVLRVLKLSELLDKISDQMLARIDKRAGEFSNADLLNYMNTIQVAIEKASKSLDLVSQSPAIQLNQQNINIEVNDNILDRGARERITSAVQSILQKAIDLNVISQEDIDKEKTEQIINTNFEEENTSDE